MAVRQRTHRARVAWAPSMVRRVLRHRLVQAVAVLAIGVGAIALLASRSAALAEQTEAWGTHAPVMVVVRPVQVGDNVADATEIRSWPVAMIPGDAVTTVGPASVAKVALYPGEAVLASRITTAGADRNGAATVTLTVPVVAQMPLLEPGDLVDLWSVDSASASSRLVVSAAVVVAFGDRDITVAVPHDQVAAAAAASLRPLTVALVG